MAAFRILLLVSLLAGVGCFVAYAVSGQTRYRGYGIRFVRWTIVAGLAFFAVLFVQRLAEGS